MALISTNEFKLQGIRGAITCKENSISEIEIAVSELISELVKRNHLNPEQIVSITFSVTNDLNACFPASIARKKHADWSNVALLDCQQMNVEGDLDHCIRILAIAWIPIDIEPQHPYLDKASSLRPDRTAKNNS